MFKWLLDNSLTNRLLVIIASVVLMAYGAFTLSRTPVDVFPDLNKPTVTIMTEAGGMAAEEVEQLITFPLETTMNGLPGVESVRLDVFRRHGTAGTAVPESLPMGPLEVPRLDNDPNTPERGTLLLHMDGGR